MAEGISNISIYYLSERSLTIQFGDELNDEIISRVNNLNRLLLTSPFPGFLSAVPAYTTLSVFYEPLKVMANEALEGADCFEKVSGYLSELANRKQQNAAVRTNTIDIPVCYGGEYGPDLEELAILHKLSPDDIIKLHSEAMYTVGMIGFVPGFAYLTGLNGKLESPRKQSPRKAVPAGSVGIAGMQTGIYSLQTPGGWQIIGRTPLTMFDTGRPQPSLLKNGDNVVFKSISAKEFEHLNNIARAYQHS